MAGSQPSKPGHQGRTRLCVTATMDAVEATW